MSTLKKWAAVKNNAVVHGGFDAPESLVLGYPERFSNAALSGEYVPEWYDENVQFIDVTDVDPRPIEGFYKNSSGTWIDGIPKLTVDRVSIPADNTTPVIVTYSTKAQVVPESLFFVVNGTLSPEVPVKNGSATLEIVSNTPGDLINIRIENDITVLSVTVKVES